MPINIGGEIDISPKTITWAITRAGYNPESFLESFPNVKKWIKKKRKPSVFELERFALYVDIPFGYLLLEAPLEEKLPIPFFKTEEGVTRKVSLNIYNIVLLMQVRKEWLHHYLKDNGVKAHSYVGKFNTDSGLEEIVDDIRNTLELTEYWTRACSNWKQALEFLVDRIESIGISIALSSSVKQDNFRSITPNECRGIALTDSLAPYIFVNSADAKAAQMFTIMYAIAHIWVGQSAGFDFNRLQPANDPGEELCYKVAAEFLLPETTFYTAWEKRKDIEQLVRLFRVSPVVVLRRAVDIGKISEFDFFRFYMDYSNQNTVKREWTSSRGMLYANKQRRMGHVLANHIQKAVKTNQLLYQDAYRLSKIKGSIYRKILTK